MVCLRLQTLLVLSVQVESVLTQTCTLESQSKLSNKCLICEQRSYTCPRKRMQQTYRLLSTPPPFLICKAGATAPRAGQHPRSSDKHPLPFHTLAALPVRHVEKWRVPTRLTAQVRKLMPEQDVCHFCCVSREAGRCQNCHCYTCQANHCNVTTCHTFGTYFLAP
jgi:hypothetical protein